MGCTGSTEGGLQNQEGGDAPSRSKGPANPGDMKLAVKEEEKLLDKYLLGKVIGQGAFGIVYACRKRLDKQEFAVKMIDQVETPLAEIKQEVEMLRMLEHECVVRLVDVYYEKVFVCMVMEIYRGGDMIEGMQAHWKAKGMIPIPVIQNVSKMMVQGVDFLHSKQVMHRDLKGDNYLMDSKQIENPKCRIYLSDFGTVIKVAPEDRLKQKCGTKTYWSPEFYDLNYTFPADMWAIGVIMFGLVTGRFPFKGEDDARQKKPRVPSRATKDGEDFLLQTLQKSEDKRITARKAMEHKFLASIKSAAEVALEVGKDEDEDKPMENAEIRGDGANAGVRDRRKDLVERMEEAQQRKAAPMKAWKSIKEASKPFKVVNEREGKTVNFAWWPADKCAGKFYDANAATKVNADSVGDVFDEATNNQIQMMLKNHKINLDSFGSGQAKPYKEFEEEVQNGQARLMLDATKHKSVVRVVDVILVRITFSYKGKKTYFINQSETYPDGRVRDNIWQLPGAKRLPHENGMESCKRIVNDRLFLERFGVKVDYHNVEVFEDDEMSPTFPGIRTVYRKQLYEANVTTTDKNHLKELALPGMGNPHYEVKAKNGYVRKYTWLSEDECKKKKVTLRAPATGTEVSALVPPPVGFAEEELQNFLSQNNVDISKFGKDGTHSLAEIAEELLVGDCRLAKVDDGRILRVVDLVILEVKNPAGEILVEESQITGEKHRETGRLPATKRRADENPFWAGHRVVEKILKIGENFIQFDINNILLVEEEKASAQYANIPTLYRRKIIPCILTSDE